MTLQPGFARISVQQRSTRFLNIYKFFEVSSVQACGSVLFCAVLTAIPCGSESQTVRKYLILLILDQGQQGSNLALINYRVSVLCGSCRLTCGS